jgi:hypothetical protein
VKLEFVALLLRPKVAQLLKEVRNMGVGIIPKSQPDHNKILIRVHKKDLSPDSHCIIPRIFCLFGPNATGIVPAEVIAFVVR